MSVEEENKAIVLNAYELFNKRELDAFLRFLPLIMLNNTLTMMHP